MSFVCPFISFCFLTLCHICIFSHRSGLGDWWGWRASRDKACISKDCGSTCSGGDKVHNWQAGTLKSTARTSARSFHQRLQQVCRKSCGKRASTGQIGFFLQEEIIAFREALKTCLLLLLVCLPSAYFCYLKMCFVICISRCISGWILLYMFWI